MHPESPHFVNMIRTASSMFRVQYASSVHVWTFPSRVVPSAADGAADGVCAWHGVHPCSWGRLRRQRLTHNPINNRLAFGCLG